MPTLTMPDQTTLALACRRCAGQRWVPTPYLPLDDRGRPLGPPRELRGADGAYTCQRCRKALAGGNVADPLVTEERHAQLAQARNRPGGPIPQGKAGGIQP